MAAGATVYASAPWAKGVCDRCGFTRPLRELRDEIYDQRPNGLRVCEDCYDKDHPQLQLGRVRVDDPQSLYDPRPDVNRPGSTTYFGWAPIGNSVTYVRCEVGDLTVSTE